MNRFAAILLLVPCIAIAEPSETVSVVIGMPAAAYANKKAKVQQVLLDLWLLPPTQANREWADSGWASYTNAAGATFVIYVVSWPQIKATATDAKLAVWKTILDDHPQIRAERTRDVPGLLEYYKLFRKESGAP